MSPSPRVFTIPPGAPFLATFAHALKCGAVLPGMDDPLRLARTVIYVPTRRAARALAHEIARAYDQPALLLPRIRPLGGLEETQTALLFGETGLDGAPALETPLAIGDIARKMLLTRQVLAWGKAMRHAIVSIGSDGAPRLDPTEALTVANTVAGAWHLAGDLAGLIDELIIEDVAWEKLDDLGGEFDEYWRITMAFLDIAISNWPKVLEERGVVDKARRQVAFTQKQIGLLQAGGDNPVIAIGSTGTSRATAQLLAAIARAPQGAVVLPGLDQGLDDLSFALIGEPDGAGMMQATTHPQAALRRLLPMLGLLRAEIVELGEVSPAMAARGRFVSEALRPADSTELWARYRAETPAVDRAQALDGIALIEAADEREEALCLAIAMRHVLEAEGVTAALVTPDRDLAARVKAELARWGIEIDDSGGDPLGVTPQGTLARLALGCAAGGRAAIDLIALLSHPLAHLGFAREKVQKLAPMIEIGILRAVLPACAPGQSAELVEAAFAAAKEHFAHPAARAIHDEDWDDIGALLAALDVALAGLETLAGEAPLARWVAAHRDALAALQAGSEEPPGEDGEVLAQLFDELEATSLDDVLFDCEAYAAFFARLSREAAVRGPRRAHPRLKILGLLEARLMPADVVLLGGLDETVWPPQSATDAFLNRPMRARLGLTTPERRIGQTAHDFAEALGNPRVILSRAAKRGGSPMVKSRFLQRMAALAGADWERCRAAGAETLAFARAIDMPSVFPPAKRPEPCPPVALRPRTLSVTRIETLRRDPYSIHAEKILKLAPLDPLGVEMGAREKGLLLHEALATFTRAHPSGPPPEDALAEVTAIARKAMEPLLANAAFRAFQWPRVEKALDYFIGFELERRHLIERIAAEEDGSLAIALDDGSLFTLTARADRIEINGDGTVTLVDYKTGGVPGMNEIRVGFSPQLTLEAAMVEQAAFANLPAGSATRAALYLKLGGQEGGRKTPLSFAGETFQDVVGDHWQGLTDLLNQFRHIKTPYLARPFVKFQSRFGKYDHLARVAEWAAGQEPEG